MAPRSGDPVRVVTSKWGGRAHWEFDGVYLGADEHGHWTGTLPDTFFSRPGREFVAPNAQVTLWPDAHWVATFHGPGGTAFDDLDDGTGPSAIDVYVDMTTVPEIHDDAWRVIDLDLDVIRAANGLVMVDDEDEFEEHQRVYGYPAAVIDAARSACAAVEVAVRAGLAPFDGPTATAWLDQLAALADDH